MRKHSNVLLSLRMNSGNCYHIHSNSWQRFLSTFEIWVDRLLPSVQRHSAILLPDGSQCASVLQLSLQVAPGCLSFDSNTLMEEGEMWQLYPRLSCHSGNTSHLRQRELALSSRLRASGNRRCYKHLRQPQTFVQKRV